MTQSQALDILKMGHNVFLTGPAGSGKTYTLKTYIDFLKEKGVGVAITASTGIAATHLGGMTIHAWSGLGVRDSLSPWDIEDLESRQYLWKRYDTTKVLIIDEISMLHHFRFDLLDKLCRSFKRKNEPFGGMQIILCGDFFQLPPVTRFGEEEAYFVYKSRAWQEMDLKICYLSEQHRQNDDAYLKVLNDIRANTFGDEARGHLHARFSSRLVNDKNASVMFSPTKLYTHNIDVDKVNEVEIKKINGGEEEYQMITRGSKPLVETLKKSCLAPEVLMLKIGAKVMFVKNNYEKGYVNGTLGVVEDFDSFNSPIVKTLSGATIVVSPESWVIEEEGKVKAEISQLPLRLAWAITVHKSQGMSLDAAEIDLSKSFIKGMGYVALSRVRSLNGLVLLGLNEMALAVDDEILEYDEILKEQSENATESLQKMKVDEIKRRQDAFVLHSAQTKKEKIEKLATHHQTKLLIKNKHSLKEIAKMREMTEETIISHIEKLAEEAKQEGKEIHDEIDLEYLREEAFSQKDFEKLEAAFQKSYEKNGDYRLAPIKYQLGNSFTYTEIRLARLFLEDQREI